MRATTRGNERGREEREGESVDVEEVEEGRRRMREGG